MSVVETVLVFVVAPLGVVLLVAVLTLAPGARKGRPRYRPGQPWDHPPVWYEPHPEGGHASGHETGPKAIGSSVYSEQPPERGQLTASDRSGDGAPSRTGAVAGAHAAPADLGGPLGGARGTW